MKVRELIEKWDEEAHTDPKKKGMFDDKTVVQLEAELTALKKAGPHPEGSAGFTKMKELAFAIRAKKAKGDKWQGVTTEGLNRGPLKSAKEELKDAMKVINKSNRRWGVKSLHDKSKPPVNKDEEDMSTPMSEAWAKEAKVKHTGRNTNKSIAKLKKERTNAKKSGNTKSIRQKNFAIRAKSHWGKAK